ncbi:MAG: DUF2062 domain-containing protein [Marinosulfonomonas sp.]|nr:DUF2062 domain-containing protein [Marinosulfonomonas sp.]
MFKRRTKRTYVQSIAAAIYPRGGWSRAVSYILLRLRRLPDPPHKIARGIAAGIFVCFTPFFGFHIVFAALLTIVMQGNMLAAVLATFFGNPLTFPIIAGISMELGSWMLGFTEHIPLPRIIGTFSYASLELWTNFTSIFTDEVAHWSRLEWFYRRIFMPYLIGGLAPGVVAAVVAYLISRPLISVYQTSRIKRLKKRYQKRRNAKIAKADLSVQSD